MEQHAIHSCFREMTMQLMMFCRPKFICYCLQENNQPEQAYETKVDKVYTNGMIWQFSNYKYAQNKMYGRCSAYKNTAIWVDYIVYVLVQNQVSETGAC